MSGIVDARTGQIFETADELMAFIREKAALRDAHREPHLGATPPDREMPA